MSSLRAVSLLIFSILLFVGVIVGVVVGLEKALKSRDRPVSPAPEIAFRAHSFDSLAGWAQEDFQGVIEAFSRTCKILLDNAANQDFLARPFGGGSHVLASGEQLAGTYGDWLDVCSAAETIGNNPEEIRLYFETNFTPIALSGAGKASGLFTGYYEPELLGALEPKGENWVPLLARPDDLVMVDLGDFREDLKGHRVAGRVQAGHLKPFEPRAEIEAGNLGAASRPIVWVDNAIDAFFLHIQGSGRVKLDTGEVMRVGYDGQNGHPYVAIGRVLVDRDEIPLDKISMQTIRAWLEANPEGAAEVMGVNTSYIFFTQLDVSDPALGPLGAAGTSLTPGRSLAVDRKFHALGVPIWLETELPPERAKTSEGPPNSGERFERLMIAQDTGGAIQGAVRGDVFFGPGPKAADLAGRMKQQGRMSLLLPNALAAHLTQYAEK
jgi:peptidoglycan lytic transglycosylase A